MSAPRPALLVAIDTEGDNQWDAAARRHQTFENLYALGRLHEFFERHGVRPTYVITHPVAADGRSAEVLRGLLARGTCEIGAHHHAWETPPCSPEDVDRHPYALSLPIAQFDAQLRALTSAVTRGVGIRPVSYRSGRFGFSAAHVSSLEQEGYLVDSSVAPLFYEAHKRGPDLVTILKMLMILYWPSTLITFRIHPGLSILLFIISYLIPIPTSCLIP